jgi:hypothetical protein
MHRRFHPLIGLAMFALLLAIPASALASSEPLRQIVDGYTLTLALPAQGLVTGQNAIAVTLRDSQGNAPDATVSTMLLAFSPAAEGHGGAGAAADDHGATDTQAPADDHAAAGDHDATDTHAPADDHAAADDHGATDTHEVDEPDHGREDAAAASAEAEHDHDAAGALEGQGIAAAPVALATASERGTHQGSLSFDKPGTWTVSVVFVIDGQEHGALFEVPVVQSRPRWLVLGGFALVNALVIGSAAVIKRRTPARASRSAARPTPLVALKSTTSSAEEQPQ